MSSDLVILSIIFFYTKRALERIAWTNMRALENCPQMEAPMQRSYSEPRNTRPLLVSSVSDPDSLNPDPDPAKNLNPDPDPGKFVTPTKNFMNFFFTLKQGRRLK